MGIEALPKLTNFSELSDWIRIFIDHPHLTRVEPTLIPLEGSKLTTLILLCIRHAVPFNVTMLRDKTGLHICQGCRELYSLYLFSRGEITIKRREWNFSMPFFVNDSKCYYQNLPVYLQKQFLSAPIQSHYLAVTSEQDFQALYTYYN